jgi:hypothetical protein
MNIGVYRQYLQQLIREALDNSDGTSSEISQYLWGKKVSGLLVRNKAEKQKALEVARRDFDEHRHWPIAITISQLGLDPKDLGISL